MKHELEKITGSMEKEASKVQQHVRNKMQQKKKSRKSIARIKKLAPLIAGILLLTILGGVFLKGHDSDSVLVAEPGPEYIAEINELAFQTSSYETRFLRNRFSTKQAAEYEAFQIELEHAAVKTFATELGIKLTKEEVMQLMSGSNALMEHVFTNDPYAKYYYQYLFDQFEITQEQYAKVVLQNQKLHEEFYKRYHKVSKKYDSSSEGWDMFLADSLAFYEEHAYEHIAAFKAKYSISEPIPKTLMPLEKSTDVLFDATIEELQLGLNENGELEFINPTHTSYMYSNNHYAQFMRMLEQERIDQQPWGPLVHVEYKEAITAYANSKTEYQQIAQEVLQILEILERSFMDDYDFLK